jgi:hypothetical protein
LALTREPAKTTATAKATNRAALFIVLLSLCRLFAVGAITRWLTQMRKWVGSLGTRVSSHMTYDMT